MRFLSVALWGWMLSVLAAPPPARSAIIGHLEADAVATIPQPVMDAAGEQRWLFTHASVGANMVSGMQALGSEAPGRYQFTWQAAGDGGQVYPPPAVTVPGTVYDAPRGNPGWAAKFAMFNNAVRNLGWRSPKIDVAMDKLCYIDPDADVSAYLASMDALAADFPGTRFVYMTMPIQSGAGQDWSNILAGTYNQAVRAHCSGSGPLLLDIADIESHDPAGNHVTFVYNGQTYERLYSGYTSDGGHLNDLGARRVALGWYAAAAAIAGAGAGVPGAPVPGRSGITSIVPNPVRADGEIRFTLDRPGAADLVIIDPAGRVVSRLFDREATAGAYASTWAARDAAGRELPSGVYFARLRVGTATSVRRFAVLRR